jgi:hypothetical protein
MEKGRCRADLLAIPAGELLPYGFDHLPLARDHLQRPGHILAQLAQPCSATAAATRRRIDHHALAWQVVGESVSFSALASEAQHRRGLGHGDFRGEIVLGGVRCKLLEPQRQLIDEPLRALRARSIDLPLELGDPQLLMGDQGQVFGRLGPRHCQRRGPGVARTSRTRARSIASAAFNASMSSGSAARSVSMTRSESRTQPADSCKIEPYPALVGRQVCRGFRQSIPSSI